MQMRNEKGFTLIEVLVSMVIFAIGILAVINMQLASSQYNLKSRHVTEGIVVAQGKVEEFRGLAYDAATLVDLGGGTDLTAGVASVLGDTIEDELNNAEYQDFNDERYKLGWNVRDDYPFEDTKTVRVIVKWNDKSLKQTFVMDMVKTDGD